MSILELKSERVTSHSQCHEYQRIPFDMVLDEILNQLYVVSVFAFCNIGYDLDTNPLTYRQQGAYDTRLTPGRSIKERSAESGPELTGGKGTLAWYPLIYVAMHYSQVKCYHIR